MKTGFSGVELLVRHLTRLTNLLVVYQEPLPSDHTESPDSNGALLSHSRKSSDARVRFIRLDAAEPASGIETKTLVTCCVLTLGTKGSLEILVLS